MLNERIYMKGWVCSTGVALKFREHEKISCYVREEALMKKIKEEIGKWRMQMRVKKF